MRILEFACLWKSKYSVSPRVHLGKKILWLLLVGWIDIFFGANSNNRCMYIFMYVYICGWEWWFDLTLPGCVIEHLPTVPRALYLLILVLLPYKDTWKLLFKLIIFCSSMAFFWNCLLLAVSVFVGDAVWGTDLTLRNSSFHRPRW